ncbi:unnamed protein product [Phytomonas sp. Hart1]|nr:unnamed protein product [Phytomonas sp. Hart1]|eukprot:CCW70652.1 unnamed protein product [Phytomonas sp. isolate Hart1]
MKVCETFGSSCTHSMISDTNSIERGGLHYRGDEFTNDSLTKTSASVVKCLMGAITKSRGTISSPVISCPFTKGISENIRATEQDSIEDSPRNDHPQLSTVTALMSDEDYSDVMPVNSSESSSSKLCTSNMFIPHPGEVEFLPYDETVALDDATFSVCASLSDGSIVFDSTNTSLVSSKRNQCIARDISTPKTSMFLVEEVAKSFETSLNCSDDASHKANRESLNFTCRSKNPPQKCFQMPYYDNSVTHSTDENTCKLRDTFKATISSSNGDNVIKNTQHTKSADCCVGCVANEQEDERESIVSICVSAPTTVNQSLSTIQVSDMGMTKPIKRYTSGEAKQGTRRWISAQKTALGQLRAEMAKDQIKSSPPFPFDVVKPGHYQQRGSKKDGSVLRQTNGMPHFKGVEDQYETPPKKKNYEEGLTLPHSINLSNDRTTPSPLKDVATGALQASPYNFSSISHISMDGAIHDALSMFVDSPDHFLKDNAILHEEVKGGKLFSWGKPPGELPNTTLNSESWRLNSDGGNWKGVEGSPKRASHVNISSRSAQLPCTTNTSSREVQPSRREKLQREQYQRKMAECTFHPIISPGSQAIIKVSASAAQRSTPQLTSALDEENGPLSSVYERLYPVHLLAEAASRRQSEEEATHRQEIEKELFLLRQRCGASYNPKPHPYSTSSPYSNRQGRFEDFAGFLSNIFHSRLGLLPPRNLFAPDNNHVVFVESDYRSPMAIAIEEEEASRSQCGKNLSGTTKKLNFNSSTFSSFLSGKYSSMEDTVCQQHHSCDSTAERFSEFLDRQNMHHVRHKRTVSMLEKEITPHFTPQTNLKSSKLMADMINRSSLPNSSGMDKLEWIKRCQANHIPVGSVLVSKSTVLCVDPCSFSPRLSPAVNAGKCQERSRQNESSVNPQATFQRLYESHHLQLQARAAARKRAEEAIIAQFPFKPALNTHKNARVSSLLKPNGYKQYHEYLKERQKVQLRLKEEMEAKERDRELGPCTFKPQVNKKPAYLSKMVSSFRLVRQLELDF